MLRSSLTDAAVVRQQDQPRGAPSYRWSRRRSGSLPRAPASARAVAPTAVAAGIRVSHPAPECVSCKTTFTHANTATTAQTGRRPFRNSRRLPSDHRARPMPLYFRRGLRRVWCKP